MKFQPVIRLPTAWTSVAGRLGVHLFDGEVTVREMDQMQSLGDAWYAKNPGKFGSCRIFAQTEARM
ncbi:Hypothetical protein A7982_05201 [Minicystis rosea]|nr:Hypothetical protein A7982_05201 [Minicystis rosea]